MTFVLPALSEDGHMLWPKHVGVTFIYELVRIFGNKFTCIFLFHRSFIILKRRDNNTRNSKALIIIIIIIIIVIIYLTANGPSPGGSGYNTCI
jgi:hypothetical protein